MKQGRRKEKRRDKNEEKKGGEDLILLLLLLLVFIVFSLSCFPCCGHLSFFSFFLLPSRSPLVSLYFSTFFFCFFACFLSFRCFRLDLTLQHTHEKVLWAL